MTDLLHPVITRLIRLRKNHGIQQQEVARRIGVDVRTLASWESGEHDPRMVLLSCWAEVLGFEVILVPKRKSPGTGPGGEV